MEKDKIVCNVLCANNSTPVEPVELCVNVCPVRAGNKAFVWHIDAVSFSIATVDLVLVVENTITPFLAVTNLVDQSLSD